MPTELSKAALLERREERVLVTQARQILEEQRDLLAHHMMDLIRDCEREWQELRPDWKGCAEAMRLALLRHGQQGLAARSDTRPATPRGAWQETRVFGARQVEGRPQAGTPPVAEEAVWGRSVEMEVLVEALRGFLARLAASAARRNNLERLADAFARTNRRVNALEYVLLPELRQSIKSLESQLDEAEREHLARVHFAKRRRA
ncbi:MAG: hypothetical protein LJE84_06625 [Gammaproteobacteria bacterium]|nr:hypothetical protein [Gammaproteobacteria bacterium]